MINYDGREFRSLDPAEASAIARYHQDGDLLWGDFAGGSVRHGSLAGRTLAGDELEFAYSCVLITGEVISGRCRSSPQLLADGRLRLSESWIRYGADASTGTSQIEQL